jgi:DNA-binding XRE family transcriptional regulator
VPFTLKAKKPKEYSETPQTLGQHLKKHRKELGLLQREVAEQMSVNTWTYLNWEKGRTEPVASQFRPIIEFLGYDPTPKPQTLAERVEAKQRRLGATASPRSPGTSDGTPVALGATSTRRGASLPTGETYWKRS